MENNVTPLVSIVNVTWNGRSLLEKHLPSLAGLHYSNFEVIIVDNGSTDGSVEFVREHYPRFKIVANEINLGTAEGSNVAIPVARGKYIFWVSNDMEFDPDIVDHLVARCESDPRIGICTVKMRRIKDEQLVDEIDSVGADLDIFGFPASRGIDEEDRGQLDYSTNVCFSFGGAMMIRKDVLEITGGYDPSFLTLADDIDLSWRVWLAGYRVVVEPKAFLYHRVSATLGKTHNRAQKRFISERNTLRTLLKNYSTGVLFFILPVYFLLLIMEMTFFLAVGRPQIAVSGIRAIRWNLDRLKETLLLRKEVQSFRKIGDAKILSMRKKFPEKFRIFLDYLKYRNTPRWKGYMGTGIGAQSLKNG
ncbi:MAG: hypothetical protein COV67_11050 [Nitrospinae bacterium CG11_big_fil_rev_8_21_14_0_20_56_8]|nr:MAG: hypothetical protein COV67_11050 [Nitrospinae bacterium CG11_big_fil_rev_8_21_14_0_20_56_8]